MVFFKSDFATGAEIIAFAVVADQLVQHYKLNRKWNEQFINKKSGKPLPMSGGGGGAKGGPMRNKSQGVRFADEQYHDEQEQYMVDDEGNEVAMMTGADGYDDEEMAAYDPQYQKAQMPPVLSCSLKNMNCNGAALGTSGNKFLPEPLVPRKDVDEHDMYAQNFAD